MKDKYKFIGNLVEESHKFNINSDILPKDGEYIIRVFSFKLPTTKTDILSVIKGLLGMDIQKVIYRVVLYLNETTVAETDVDPDAWDEIRGQTIKRLINYVEDNYERD